MSDIKRTKLTRRNILIGGALAAGAYGGYTVFNRPKDKSGPRDPYFVSMQKALLRAGIGMPTLILDKARLDANIDYMLSQFPQDMAYRLPSKSVPCLKLIEYIRKRTGSNRLMTFNQPMLLELSQAMPEADQLLGKPLTAMAVKKYFEDLPTQNKAASENVRWLVDTPQRLEQYASIAESFSVPMKIAIELDVGLHRGGMVPGEGLDTMLADIEANSRLSFAGYMGYEPHLAHLPTSMGMRKKGIESAWDIYGRAKHAAATRFDSGVMKAAIFNAAGSPTFRLYDNTDIANELCVASALVKPTSFDMPLLESFEPASFIATPVLKTYEETRVPGLEKLTSWNRFKDPNTAKTIFTHGGYWKATPIDPPGLQINSTFGRSTNQEMLNGGQNLDIKPDEFVFMRPNQSEFVFLQFGDIAIYEDGKITEKWPVFSASA